VELAAGSRGFEAGVKLRFLLARRVPDGPSQIVDEASAILSRRGFEVSSIIAEETVVQPEHLGAEADLWLLKSYTPLSLSLAGVLHGAGARVLNPYPACFAARNKITAAQVLHAAKIPAPASWVTFDLPQLRGLLRYGGLVVKPQMGWRGEGVRIVRDERDLQVLPPFAEPVLVQELIDGPGEDLRVYVAGKNVFATRKRFSRDSFSVPGRPATVTDEIRRIALRCGEAFGLGLYGLDIIESRTGPRVVDVNYFPGFKGIAGAADAVAGYIAEVAASARPLARAGGVR
jgi:ribosomal protein S6--L-glutamate ligase